MSLYYLKYRCGDDVLAYIYDNDELTETDKSFLTLTSPVRYQINMQYGPFMEDMLFLSSEDQVRVHKGDIMYVHPASETAMEYYNKFHERDQDNDSEGLPTEDGPTDLLDEILSASSLSKKYKYH
jgi:hypothetical protein